MSGQYDNPADSAECGDDGFPGWLCDGVLGAVVGAWAQEERGRAAAQLLMRVHRIYRDHPRRMHLIPPTAGQVLDAQRRGWLP